MKRLILLVMVLAGCGGAGELAEETEGLTTPTCGAAGQGCCPVDAKHKQSAPPKSRPAGRGSCESGLLCASTSCPPMSTCIDGSANTTTQVTWPTYCFEESASPSCGKSLQACCAVDAHHPQTAPPKHGSPAAGWCETFFACTSSICPAHAQCADGSYNVKDWATYPVYCTGNY